jgi:hypothetical protein
MQMEKRRITPSRWYYGLAGVVFLVGVVLFARIADESMSLTRPRL